METEGSLSCLSQPATYREPDESSLRYVILLKIHFNIVLAMYT
jgi:hypothetical protein